MTDYDSDSSGEFVLGGVASMTMDTEEATPPPPPETTQRLETLVFQSLPVPSTDPESPYNVLVNQLASGSYLEMLESSPLIATLLNDSSDSASSALTSHDPFTSFLLSIASFNIYLQSNYTGPAIPEETVAASLKKITGKDVETNSLETQNELAVDGDLVTPVSTNLLFFSLSKKLLAHLTSLPKNHLNFKTLDIWSLRLHKCHFSLLQLDSQPPPPFSTGIYNKVEPVIERLTKLVASTISRGSITSTVTYFTDSIFSTLPPESSSDRVFLSTVSLELGLVSQMFEQNNLGKPYFNLAAKWSGLKWSVTGREGKKTKFQEKAIAMMVVLAESELEEMRVEESMKVVDNEAPSTASHEENNHLLERTQFTDSTVNTQKPLTKLDQSILLAFCLDVKNDNPADGLTSEQMSPFLERVLLSHDSWMIYSTALLERAWLECETSNRRERAIIQIQALVDQHGNRLTITQSTFKAAIEDSAPPQVRLENVHGIVYPPRWGIKKDLGERYAKMGIVSTAAEIFEEIHLWDEVVECLKHAGKKDKAKLIVEKQLKKRETPRMWAAMGDLTDDAQYYVKAWDLSGRKYARAKAAIGRMEFDKGNLRACYDHMLVATEVKPLTPSAWFLLGTCSMRLDEWGTALKSFSNVVTQRPDDCDAWANVAAIHIHNKAPASAYPALNESLKQRRNNWRVWINKLYVCMDLGKIDEAIQSLHTLIDFKTNQQTMKDIPDVDDKVVKNIVFMALKDVHEAGKREVNGTDFDEKTKEATIDSKSKTLKRAGELLGRISSVIRSEPWVWELYAYYYECLKKPHHVVIETLMKLHRLLLNKWGNGEDEKLVENVCKVSVKVISLHLEIFNGEGEEGEKNEAKTKAAMLWRGLMKKVEKAFEFRGGEEGYPDCVKEVAELGKVLNA